MFLPKNCREIYIFTREIYTNFVKHIKNKLKEPKLLGASN